VAQALEEVAHEEIPPLEKFAHEEAQPLEEVAPEETQQPVEIIPDEYQSSGETTNKLPVRYRPGGESPINMPMDQFVDEQYEDAQQHLEWLHPNQDLADYTTADTSSNFLSVEYGQGNVERPHLFQSPDSTTYPVSAAQGACNYTQVGGGVPGISPGYQVSTGLGQGMTTAPTRPDTLGWSQYQDEHQPGCLPENIRYKEELQAKTEEVTDLKRILEEERLCTKLGIIQHESQVTTLSSELTLLQLERESDQVRAKTELDEATNALVQAHKAFTQLREATDTRSEDAFARKSVNALHNALMKCKMLLQVPPATNPQGWASLDYLSCVPVNGVYISILPLDAGEDKCQFDWKAIRVGLCQQLFKLREHLSEVTMEHYTMGSYLPELDELIKILRVIPRSPGYDTPKSK
jgi:cellobiose-specific phosphotransferase system component IIA